MLLGYFSIILDSWNALQFSIENRTGGLHTLAIVQWMKEVTEKFFLENDNLDADEVASYLSTIMDQELHTLVEDGSDMEISMLLCKVFKLHKEGNKDAIQELLLKLPSKSNLQHRNIQNSQSDDETEEYGTMPDELSDLSISDSASWGQSATSGQANTPLSLDELDGWTVVKKGRQKNK